MNQQNQLVMKKFLKSFLIALLGKELNIKSVIHETIILIF